MDVLTIDLFQNITVRLPLRAQQGYGSMQSPLHYANVENTF